jgi:adenylate kinase
MQARGEAIRADDNPEALEKRVHAYRLQTAPLVSYYSNNRLLHTTDGMASIDEVSAAIDRILGKGEKAAAPSKRAPRKKAAAATKRARPARGTRKKAAKAKKAVRKRPAKARVKPRVKVRPKSRARPAARRAPAKRKAASKTRRKAINKAGRRG